MRKDIKDLKKFKGNEHGGLYGLFPIDRKKTVKDIPKLGTHEVNVIAKFFRNAGSKVTAFRVVLCRVDELPDFNGDDQGDFIIQKIRNAKDNMVKENKVSKTGGERTVSDLIEKYNKEVLPSLKDGEHYQNYLRDIWEPEIGHLILDEVTADDIRKVRNKLKEQGFATATINNRVQPIKSAFSFGSGGMEQKGFDCVPKWIETDVAVSVKAWKENNVRERSLSADELKRLREQIKISTSDNLSDFFEFKLAAGCRWSEAMGLTWDNIDFDKKIITFSKVLTRSKYKGQKTVKGKTVNEYEHHVMRNSLKNGENSRIIDMQLYPEIMKNLRDRKIKTQIYSKKVFISSPRKAFETALKRAEIKDFCFHAIRHTTMTYLAMEGATPFELKAQGGHKDIKSVERYAHFDPQLSRNAAEKLRRKIYANG